MRRKRHDIKGNSAKRPTSLFDSGICWRTRGNEIGEAMAAFKDADNAELRVAGLIAKLFFGANGVYAEQNKVWKFESSSCSELFRDFV